MGNLYSRTAATICKREWLNGILYLILSAMHKLLVGFCFLLCVVYSIGQTICELSDNQPNISHVCLQLPHCCYNSTDNACRHNYTVNVPTTPVFTAEGNTVTSGNTSICVAKRIADSCLADFACAAKSAQNCTECEFCCWDGIKCWGWKNDTATSTCNNPANAKFCSDLGSKFTAKDYRIALLMPKPDRKKRYHDGVQVTVTCLYPFYLDPARGNTSSCTTSPIPNYDYSETPITKGCKCAQWMNVPECLRGCEAVSPIPNMQEVRYTSAPVTHGLYDQETLANFFCNDGYYLESSMARCSQIGKWSIVPQCIGGCRPIPSMENTLISYGGETPVNGVYRQATVAKFSCGEGYYLSSLTGVVTTKCVGLNWWGLQPKCLKGCTAITPTDGLTYDQAILHGVYPIGTVAYEACLLGSDPKDSVNNKQTCGEDGIWSGTRNVCIRKDMCQSPNGTNFFKQCEIYGNRSCSTLSKTYYGTCKKCCNTMSDKYDALCVAYGCFCYLGEYQTWVTEESNRKTGGANQCFWSGDAKSNWTAYDQKAFNEAMEIAIARFYQPSAGMGQAIASDIRNGNISQLSGFFGVLSDEGAYAGVTSSNFLTEVGLLCNILRHFKAGTLFTLEGQHKPNPKSMLFFEPTNATQGNYPYTVIVESKRRRDIPFLQQVLLSVSETLAQMKEDINYKGFADTIKEGMALRLNTKIQFGVFVTPVRNSVVFFDDGFQERFRSNGYIYIFRIHDMQVVIVKLPK